MRRLLSNNTRIWLFSSTLSGISATAYGATSFLTIPLHVQDIFVGHALDDANMHELASPLGVTPRRHPSVFFSVNIFFLEYTMHYRC